jgi:acyl phosphate:glycerol-3-phosphate acyltransferase
MRRRQALPRGNPELKGRGIFMPTELQYAASFLFGYLCGSVPFGILLTRFGGGPDLRNVGSGNIGATNVLRTGRKGLAAATLIGDVLKGTVAVLLIAYFFGQPFALAAAVGAFLGHLFPVWLGFRGGKGVATYIGLLLGLVWPAALVFGAIWLAVAAISRYSSLAALIASAATPVFLWWTSSPQIAAVFVLLSALLWIKHRANIARLARGTEGKISFGAKTA